ncbi:hypothetical protein V5O48_008298, partial [Marasmius crinis-equi]
MTGSTTSSSDEKAGTKVSEPKGAEHVNEKAKVAEVEEDTVSFFQLFRFATTFELALNAIGLVAAACAGAANPLMTLLFGKLVQAFVNFQIAANNINSTGQVGDAARDSFPQVAAAFRHDAAMLALWLTVIGVGQFLVTYIYMFTWVYTGEVNAKRVREHYLRAVLRQDIAFFDKVGAGEVTTRIQTDTHLVQQGTSEKVALVVNYLSAFFTAFILSFARSWRLALALCSILPVTTTAGFVMSRFISRYMQQSRGFIAAGGSLAEEVISTVRTAKAFGSQKTLSGLYDEHIEKSRIVDTKAAVIHGCGLSVFFFVIYSAYGLAFSFGVTLTLRGEADVGVVTNVFMAFLIGSFVLSALPPELQAIGHARGAATKLYSTIDRVPAIDSADPGGLKPDDVEGELSLENVTFAYPSRPGIIVAKNLSLTFATGKKAALVGSSGSGKSTVIALIERFYDPLSGVVRLDGQDIRTLNLKWLRSQIGLVSQEPTLFATTIKGNVAHGLINTPYEHASDEKKFGLIKEACIKANADGFISKLPNGYDTMVGERGFLLSGGQKQRIAIARAIVSDPKILLLDEATSALDTQSEGIVQDALDKAAAGRTTITIAHRLSTIKDADVIYVIGDGMVLEQGSHNDLLADENGPYAKLVQAQKLREATQGTKDSKDDSSATPTPEDIEKQAEEEVPLGRKDTSRSLASEILEKKTKKDEKEEDYGLPYLFVRMGGINKSEWKRYVVGIVAASLTGFVYPSFGIIYAKAINAFTDPDPKRLRFEGDRNALWFFVIALGSSMTIGLQNYNFAAAAATLSKKIRSLSFRAILRQDVEFFDQDEHSTGSLTTDLSDDAQKVNGLAGITLGAIVQSVSTLVAGLILGIIFTWKLGLIGAACAPLLVCTGYIRLRVVVMKDQANRKSHASSAQLACEAAASIRTVASLTREDDCSRLYSESLEEPLRRSNRTALWSNALFAASQAMMFFAIALSFWYGSIRVSVLEYNTFRFFVGLMCSTFAALQAGNVFAWVPDISSAKGSASSIIRLLDARPLIDAESSTEGGTVDPAKVVGRLRFENVHFRYPTRPGVRVLRGLSLQIEPGT